MTDRINALTVVLDKDIRDDDIKSLVDAIYMLKHVLSVDLNVSDLDDHIARDRARMELEKKLWKALRE
jgi:hypothetical protein